MSKTDDTTRTLAYIDAVQDNAGVGLTRGDVDRLIQLARVDHPGHSVWAQMLTVLDPGHRHATDEQQMRVTVRARNVRDAVRTLDELYGRTSEGVERMRDLARTIANQADAIARGEVTSVSGAVATLLGNAETLSAWEKAAR